MTGSVDPLQRWDRLTSPEIREVMTVDPVVVLPLAAVEQHGPHLPLSTDRIIGDGIVDAALDRLADEDLRVLRLPTQGTGASREHEAFPGTLSLAPGTLEGVLVDLGASLARAGMRRLVIANSHGGNRSVVDRAALTLRKAHAMLVVKAHYFLFPPPEDVHFPEGEWRHGIHGGALETAMMLHLDPESVRREELRPFPSLGEELEESSDRLAPEGAAAFAWSAEDLSPDGVVGDATLADAETGARLVAHYAGCLADVIRDAHRFPVERLRGPDGR